MGRRLRELLPGPGNKGGRGRGSRKDDKRKQQGGLLSGGRGFNYHGDFFPTAGAAAPARKAKQAEQVQEVQLTESSNGGAPALATQMSLVPPPSRFKHKTRRREEKPTALLRAWVRVDPHGESSIVHADKMSLAAQLGIQLRDLRLLESQLSNQASVILCRERAIVINMMFVKTIITTDTCYVVSPDDERSIQFMTELKRRLQEPLKVSKSAHRLAGGATTQAAGKGSKAPQAQAQQAQQQQQQALAMLQAQQALELPFELRVLEICLDELACDLDERATQLEAAAYPAVDAMAKLADRPHLDRVRRVKNTLIQLYKTTETFHEALQALLDNDKDMWDMNLGAKGAARQLAEETLGLVDRLSEPPHLPPVQEEEGPGQRHELQPRYGPLDVVREDEVLMTSYPGMHDHMDGTPTGSPTILQHQQGTSDTSYSSPDMAGHQPHGYTEQQSAEHQYGSPDVAGHNSGSQADGVHGTMYTGHAGGDGRHAVHSHLPTALVPAAVQPDVQAQPASHGGTTEYANQSAQQQDVTSPRSPSPFTALACTPASWGQHDAAGWNHPLSTTAREHSTVQGEPTEPMDIAAGGLYSGTTARVFLGASQDHDEDTEHVQGHLTPPVYDGGRHSDGSAHRRSPWLSPFAAATPSFTGLTPLLDPAWTEGRASMSLARLSRRSLAALSMRHGSSLASSSALSSVYDMEVAQVEMILDAYFLHVNHVWRRLKNLSEYIEDTEEMVYSSLNATRNRLLAYDLGFLGMNSMSLLCTGITGLLTTNLYHSEDEHWITDPASFLEVVFIGCLGCYLLLGILVAYYMHTGVVQFT